MQGQIINFAAPGNPGIAAAKRTIRWRGLVLQNGTLAAIDRAEKVIGQFEGADIQHRWDFVAHTLFKRRMP